MGGKHIHLTREHDVPIGKRISCSFLRLIDTDMLESEIGTGAVESFYCSVGCLSGAEYHSLEIFRVGYEP